MPATPTALDHWCAERLAAFVGRFPSFDVAVQSAIDHNLLGGLWFALALFVLWVSSSSASSSSSSSSSSSGGASSGSNPTMQYRIIVIFAGSMVAIALTVVAGALVTWLPPNRTPGLAQFFPSYLGINPNTTSFPSESLAVYTAIAAGVRPLRRRLGTALFVAIPFLIALPRMYVGGHYLTDVVVGFALGLIGFWSARLLGDHLPPAWRDALGRPDFLPIAKQVVIFVWMLEVATEFRDASWLLRVVHIVARGALHM